MGVMDRYEKKKRQESSNNKTTTMGVMERYERDKLAASVDQKYIDSFFSDIKIFSEGESTLSFDDVKTSISDLGSRQSAIGAWLSKNKDRLDEETYNSMSDTLSSLKNYIDGANSYYSKWETEEDYQAAVKSAEEQEKLKTLDIDAYQKEIDALKLELENYKPSTWSELANGNRTKELENQISVMEAYLTRAQRVQEGIKLSGVVDAEDFEEFAQKGADMASEMTDWGTWKGGNNRIEAYRGEAGLKSSAQAMRGGGRNDDIALARAMTEEEANIYNYYFAKFGEDKAEEYFKNLEETLSYRIANGAFENIKGNLALEYIAGIGAGLDQFASGMESLFSNEDYIPTSSSQYLSGMVREDLEDDGFKIFGTSIGQIGYDFLNTGANMLPSILIGSATGGWGSSILLGASAAGNAKAEMLNLGYSKAQANAYGILVGGSEALLQKFLGGIVGMSDGGIFTKLGEKVLTKIDHALARAAIQLGTDMLDEGLEEGIQTLLEPWFKSIVTGADFEAPNIDEVLYSSLLGALTAGAFDLAGAFTGKGAIGENIEVYKQGKEALAQGIDVSKLSEFGTDTKFFSADSVAYRLAGKVNENTGAYTVGRLLNEMNAQLTVENQNDIIRSLERKHFAPENAQTIATALAQVVAGEQITKSQAKLLESNPLINQTIQDVIINQNSTVNQRLRGFNEAMQGKSSTATQETTGEAETISPTENTSAEQSAENEAINASENGKTILASTGEVVNIQKVTETKGGLKVELDNGMVVSASDLSYGSTKDALMFEMFSRMEASPTSTNAMMNAFKPSSLQEASLYQVGVPLAYQYGKIGYKEGLKSIKMSQKAKQYAYNRGREDAQANASSKDQARAVASQTKTETETDYKADEKGIVYENGFVYDESKASKIQKVSMAHIDVISKMTNLEVHVFESVIKDGKRVAIIDGKEIPAPNGFFRNGNQIYIDINAGNKGEGAMLFTLSHEVTHYIRRWNEQGFKELGDFLLEQYGKNGVSVERRLAKQREKIENRYKEEGKALPSEAELNDRAYEELVADAMSDMLADPRAYEKLAQLKQQNLKLWQKVGEAIKNVLKKLGKALGVYKNTPVAWEAYHVRDFAPEVYEKLQDLYIKAFVEADANYEGYIGSRNLNDFADAVNENGEALFQYKAMEADEEQYRHMLHKWGKMSAVEIDNLFDTIDNAMELIKANLEALDYAWEADIDDRSFSPIKKNTDKLYKVSVDFSTLCRKRLLQQTIQARLQEALDRSLTKEEGIAIRDALMTIQEEGRQIEIACALCYVESARMKSHNQIKKFLNNREDVLKNFFASKSGGDIKSRIKQAEAEARERLGVGDTPLTRLPANAAKEIREAKKEAKASYAPSPKEAELINVAKGMTVNDFATPAGLENLAKNYPELFDAYASFIVNATHAKGIENDTWWRAGDSYARNKSGDINISDTLIVNMNRENGLRSQSWSDFQVIHLLDYIAATIELSTRNSKEQIYTKVPDFVDLMGLTNAMLNMSLIPTREFKGSLEYDAVEGMPYDIAIKLREAYPNTAGTICIGVDNVQIKLLLGDITIDYVIPYHRSGMSAHTRKAMHLPSWSEYEDYQSEKNLSRAEAEKQAKKYGVKLLDVSDPNYQKGTSFSEWFDLREAKQIAKMENANPTDKAKQKKYGVMYGGYMAMQNAANNYLKLCAERGLSPKFSHENANFTTEENYWKLLIDRKMVNNATGEIIEQQSLKPIFSEEKILRILNDELERYPKVKADQEYAIRRVTEKMLSGEIKGGMSAKAIADVMKKPVDNVAKVNILASAEDMKLSDRDSLGNELSAEQQEFFKDSKIRDSKGNLKVVYHGTKAQFNTFAKGDIGFHFGTKGAARGRVGTGKNVTIKEVYLNITNPISINKDLGSWNADTLAVELFNMKLLTRAEAESVLFTDDKLYRRSTDSANKKLREMLLEKGYDGIEYRNTFESKKDSTSYIAFNSNQIKEIANQNPTPSADIRYSVRDIVGESGTNYGKGVYLDSTLLTNLTEDERVEMVKEYLKEIGGSVFTAYDDKGNPVDVHIVKSNRKFKNAKGKKVLVNQHLTNYVLNPIKQEAIALIDELILTARQGGTEPASHPHDWLDNNGKNDWDVWRTYIQDKEKTVWEAKLNIANSVNGEKILYEVYPIKKVEGVEKIDTASTEHSISQSPDSVNTKFSDRDSYAPTFYSHMGKVVDDIKLEKMGAGGVVSYLKGKGVKNEEIKWSGIETWLEGKKSITKKELQEFIERSQLQIEEENVAETKWSQYKLEGGTNYREILFTLPNSSYSNRAMRGHWGKEAEGILVHTRVQDFTVDGKKMLFIEELQSDWHNEGHSKGYTNPEYEDAVAVYDRLAKDYDNMRRAFNKYVRSSEFRSDPDDVGKKKFNWLRSKMETAEKRMQEAEMQVDSLKEKGAGDTADAPFRDNYHEYVLKRLIRMAAEEGYDSIGWTPADIQSDRWSDEYAEGYRIEYDQDMPKFLNKYGKKWGAKVGTTTVNGDTEIWFMDITDSMKNSALYEGQVMYSERDDLSQIRKELDSKYNIDPRRVSILADSYMENYGGVLKKAQFHLPFFTITRDLAEASVTGNAEVLERADREIKELAEEIVGSPKIKGEVIDTISAIKKHLKGIRIKIPKFNKGDFDAIGGFENFRKKHMGKLLLANDGLAIDTLYPELQELFGTGYFPNEITNVADQLMKIAEVIDTPIKSEINYDVDEAREYMVGELYDKISKIVFNEKDSKYINYRDTELVSNRTLLANALESVAQNEIEENKLKQYKEKISLIESEQAKLDKVKAEAYKLRFTKGRTPAETKRLRELDAEATQIANRISTYDKQLLNLESTTALKNVLQREKEMVRKREKQKGYEALRAYKEQAAKTRRELMTRYQESRKNAVAKVRETRDKNEAKEKLQKLVLKTSEWISYPKKEEVKCPDFLREPYAKFLNSIDMSSKRLLEGGDPTKNDLRMANAMSNLANAIEKIKIAQDPSITTDNILDAGYIDLPADFVEKLRDMAKHITDLMVEGDYVINRMQSGEIGQLSQLIRTLNHSIKEMATLYSNLRFSNVETLGSRSMSFLESMGEAKNTNGVKDFAFWDNALPFYAFKRFGEAGESVFTEFMDAQDKLALLAKEIFDFKDKTWTDKEAKAWGEDTHTINLLSGKTLTLTTADAMGIYCLSRRKQGLQHLLGGGVRVIGIKKGSKKSSDSRSTLTHEDIRAIGATLTERQKKVAETIQAFMSTTCSKWGNEITMRRFLTEEFTEEFYYPIESNDENLATKDPKAQQSDLYRLLNISATKPLIQGANNEVIIRNIFEVFTGHASDMARLNAFGMPLLDYMKWLNYREKTISDDGQINVRGVRKSMNTAYGEKAFSYVLNLVKDINGRHSDGDNSFLMGMMRMAKTASVGNNLRVVILQMTSYPRALEVLSAGSLAKGLSKLPNIARAKQYSGITLWKSFGFYDTNIARSIEEQIKGSTNVRQKLIELSLKGAEWADAITWGALWNACEYEVAKTTKNRVGSEEFYNEVALKLREVVYATQVVDSVLTRSQIMRSKSGLTQAATSFMAEPTLSYNILMDGAFQFQKEKRITGSAKLAWAKTGKTIGRKVAVYSSVALFAALMEGLADAWRDDDDEEFGEKFKDAFIKNAISDIIPFNKIPIFSDIVGLILSRFDVGYFSSDSLEMTWLSNINDALNAWAKVLGEEDTSTTVYNAIYKTTKALSSMTGISVSGMMREVVALWNNTAGAYDSTLKIKSYEATNEELGNSLYDALVDGNDRQAESIKQMFGDEKSMESALRKALKENDPRIKEAAQAIYEGNVEEYSRIFNELLEEGNFDLEIIKGAIDSVVSQLKPKDDSATDNTDKVESMYETNHYYLALLDGDTNTASKVKEDIINTAIANGKSREEAEKSFTNGFKGNVRDGYADGTLTRNEAMNMLISYGGMDSNDAYWEMKKLDYYVENGSYDGYSKYDGFYDAVRTGKNLKNVIAEYTGHGVDTKTLASQITSYFKPLYISMTNSERAGIKGYLLNAYAQLGYNRYEKSKDIDNWLK